MISASLLSLFLCSLLSPFSLAQIDRLTFQHTPIKLPADAIGNFPLSIQYTSAMDATLVVDILEPSNGYHWYGKGSAQISSGTDLVPLSIKIYSPIPVGAQLILKAWTVDTDTFRADESTAWQKAIVSVTVPVSAGTELEYAHTSSLADSEDGMD